MLSSELLPVMRLLLIHTASKAVLIFKRLLYIYIYFSFFNTYEILSYCLMHWTHLTIIPVLGWITLFSYTNCLNLWAQLVFLPYCFMVLSCGFFSLIISHPYILERNLNINHKNTEKFSAERHFFFTEVNVFSCIMYVHSYLYNILLWTPANSWV